MSLFRKLIGVPIFVVGWTIFIIGALIGLAGFEIAGFETSDRKLELVEVENQ